MYAKYLLNVSAEQVAIICLSEFMKKVLKYMYQPSHEQKDKEEGQYILEGEEDISAVYIVNTELMGDIGREINK